MTNTYTIHQLKLYFNNNIVKQHFNDNWNMTPYDLVNIVESYLSKQRDYFRDYYHSRKSDADVTSKIQEHNRNWYQNNKKRIAALQRCKYSSDPEYKQWYQQYQALCAQQKRNVISNERNVGRPRKYNIASSCSQLHGK